MVEAEGEKETKEGWNSATLAVFTSATSRIGSNVTSNPPRFVALTLSLPPPRMALSDGGVGGSVFLSLLPVSPRPRPGAAGGERREGMFVSAPPLAALLLTLTSSAVLAARPREPQAEQANWTPAGVKCSRRGLKCLVVCWGGGRRLPNRFLKRRGAVS